MKNKVTGLEVLLHPEHIIGRGNDKAHTKLEDPTVSRVHAQILWDSAHWSIRDYSTNGTFINKVSMTSHTSRKLKIKDEINFGSLDSCAWEIINIDAPVSRLIPELPGLDEIELKGVIGLPSDDKPEFQIYPVGNGDWAYEVGNSCTVLRTGDFVGQGKAVWRFVDSRPEQETQKLGPNPNAPLSKDIKATFNVSQNEEYVTLTLSIDDQKVDLGQRSHNYLLLILARKRIEDQKSNFITSEQGWLHSFELEKLLGQEETHNNIQIYRARKQLESAMPELSSNNPIIERRRGQIRFAYEHISVVGGFRREH